MLCAVISYAVIEMAKRLLPMRELVEYRYILQWWRARAWSVGASGDLSWAQLTQRLWAWTPDSAFRGTA